MLRALAHWRGRGASDLAWSKEPRVPIGTPLGRPPTRKDQRGRLTRRNRSIKDRAAIVNTCLYGGRCGPCKFQHALTVGLDLNCFADFHRRRKP